MNADEILQFIEKHAGPYGITISKYDQANGPYWIVAGAGCHAGGYPTMQAGIEAWVEGVKYDKSLKNKQDDFVILDADGEPVEEEEFAVQCSGCGRKSFIADEGADCKMSQPYGNVCGGVFEKL